MRKIEELAALSKEKRKEITDNDYYDGFVDGAEEILKLVEDIIKEQEQIDKSRYPFLYERVYNSINCFVKKLKK